MTERESFARYVERMAARGFRPSKRWGQNFLLDPTLQRLLAQELAPTRADLVLEVGAGLGFLTRELAALAGAVVAVEIDRKLVELLREELTSWPDASRVELVHADVLGAGDELAPPVADALQRRQQAGDLLIGANLPYAISGPFVARLPVQPRVPERAVLLVQLDFAERMQARSGRDASALSLLLQLGYDVELLRRVGRDVFRPRPRVDSAILRLRRRADASLWTLDVATRRAFAAFLRASFASRRKQVGASWARWQQDAGRLLPDAARAVATQRPDEIAAEEYLNLWRGSRAMGEG